LTEFDGLAVDEVGAGAGDLHGLVVVGGLDDEVASEDLLRLAVGAFGDEDLVLPGAEETAAFGELAASAKDSALDEALAPGHVFVDEVLDLFRGEVVELFLGLVQQKDVLGHDSLLVKDGDSNVSSRKTIEQGSTRQNVREF